MELTIPSIAIGAFLILMLGFLGRCAYYSWENHYRFTHIRGEPDRIHEQTA